MRYVSILFSLVLVGGLIMWYLNSGTSTSALSDSPAAAPQHTIKQAEDAASALQRAIDQQQQRQQGND